MARLRGAKPKNVPGSYERLFNSVESPGLDVAKRLGNLASKIQSAVISSGSELESMIADRVENISDLNAFLKQEIMPEGVLLARKRQIRKSTFVSHNAKHIQYRFQTHFCAFNQTDKQAIFWPRRARRCCMR